MTDSEKFYVTTPIYYVTARPHLGSLYSTLLADVAKRWHMMRGYNTFMLTGTDEHGQKIAQAAQKAGKEPKEFVDSFISAYKSIWKSYEIEYDHFIRTTDENHIKAVQNWLKLLQEKGDIYKSVYKGWYCTPCETFVTEKEAEAVTAEQTTPVCPSCARCTNAMEEECYFFKLSAYQDKLLQFFQDNPDFITPAERFQEVINFVKSGLKDLSISRTTISWGIPFPGDAKHITYVWADALTNYITAIGYGNPKREKEFSYWWPADVQIMGKDIVRFHAIYWPAFLMASELPLPKKLLVHGWLKVNNQKMSKSFGNIIDPQELLNTYGPEPVRYYLTRYMAITQDAEFSTGDLEQRINADLADELGNLLNRVTTLAHKHNLTHVNPPLHWSKQELELRDSFWTLLEDVLHDMHDYYFHRAYANLWKFIKSLNAYFHGQEPWKVAATDKDRFAEIISATCHGLYAAALLTWPVMPSKMQELLASLGISFTVSQEDMVDTLRTNPWTKQFVLTKINTLFTKYETKQLATPQDTSAEKSMNIAPKTETPAVDNIAITDFAKLMLVVGTIDQCEEVPKSDKLLKLQVNFGEKGIRQILSGIKKDYKPEDLIGKQAIFIYNLAPRTMMGLESHGMLLATKDADGKIVYTTPATPVQNGMVLS